MPYTLLHFPSSDWCDWYRSPYQQWFHLFEDVVPQVWILSSIMLIDMLLINTALNYHWIESNDIALEIDEPFNRKCRTKYPWYLKKNIRHFHLVLYRHTKVLESKDQSGCPCNASNKFFPLPLTLCCSDFFVRCLCRENISSLFEPFGVWLKGHMLLRSGY